MKLLRSTVRSWGAALVAGVGALLWLTGIALALDALLLEGYVFWDVNQNGVWDSGEPGVPAAPVRVEGEGGTPVFTTTTDLLGYFVVEGLPAGNWIVSVSPPQGYVCGVCQGQATVQEGNPGYVELGLFSEEPPPPPTPTPTPTLSPTPSPTPPPTSTPTPTLSPTPSPTSSPPPTSTPKPTEVPPPTSTFTPSPQPTIRPVSLAVDPSTGVAGQTLFRFVGSNFLPNESVRAWLMSPGGAIEAAPGGAANQAGGVSLAYTWPASFAEGLYTLTVEGALSAARASASFYLKAGEGTPTVVVGMTPTSGAPRPSATISRPRPTITVDPLLAGLSIRVGDIAVPKGGELHAGSWAWAAVLSLLVLIAMIVLWSIQRGEPNE